jgi:hypothetical protein
VRCGDHARDRGRDRPPSCRGQAKSGTAYDQSAPSIATYERSAEINACSTETQVPEKVNVDELAEMGIKRLPRL